MSATMSKTIRPHVRWMIGRDMEEVLEIENLCFEFPWSEEDFIRCLRQRNVMGLAAEVGPRVAGMMLYEIHSTRLVVLNLAVLPAVQRLGVGRSMVEKLKSHLLPGKRTRLVTEVRETNLDAQLFFRAMGFRAVDVLRDFYDTYSGATEDAILFQYRLPKAQVKA